jgi:ribosomal protein S15P/S13E
MAKRDDLGGGGRTTSPPTSQQPNPAASDLSSTGKPPFEPTGVSNPMPNLATGSNPPAAGQGHQGQPQGAQAQGVAQHAKEEVKNLASEAKEQTAHLAGQAKDQVSTLMTQQKDQAAQRLGSFAGALREAARKLNDEDGGGFGRYADRAAEQVDRMSSYLRERDFQTFLRDTEQFARRRPDVFLGGTFLAGLLAARFLKASGERTREPQYPATARTGAYQPYPRQTDVGTATNFGTGATTYGAASGGSRPLDQVGGL